MITRDSDNIELAQLKSKLLLPFRDFLVCTESCWSWSWNSSKINGVADSQQLSLHSGSFVPRPRFGCQLVM